MRTVSWVVGCLAMVGWAVSFGQGLVVAKPPQIVPVQEAPVEVAPDQPIGGETPPAAKPPASEQAPSPPPTVSPEELEKLVQQLDADSFSDRQAASQRLAELGRAAIDALVRAATSESLEANLRSLDILKKHLESQDQELSKSAKEALEKIAAGPRAPSARRAKDILKNYEERIQTQKQMAGPGGVQMGVPAVPVPVQPQVHKMRVIQGTVREVRKEGETQVVQGQENDVHFRIAEHPKEGITVELTRLKDGKEVTEKFQAKNAEELQKQHPEAYQFYKRHYLEVVKQGGQAVWGVGPGVKLGGPVQVQPVAPGGRRWTGVDTATMQLPMFIRIITQTMATEQAIKDSTKESLEKLKQESQKARQALEELEKRLQEAIEQKEKEEKEKKEDKQDKKKDDQQEKEKTESEQPKELPQGPTIKPIN